MSSDRFDFGKNRKKSLENLDEERIKQSLSCPEKRQVMYAVTSSQEP